MFSLYEGSGYLWNCFIYVGKNGEPNPKEKAWMLEKNEHDFRRNKNLLPVKFKIKRKFLCCPFCWGSSNGKIDCSGENIWKWKVIHDYNQKMGGVYKNDTMFGNYSWIQKTNGQLKCFFTI